MNITRKGDDGTLARNNIKFMQNIITEYELIKAKKHTRFRFIEELYAYHKITRQNFFKHYNRLKQTNDPNSLLPRKRGPKYKRLKAPKFIEQKVIDLRKQGLSRYDIFAILKPKYGKFTPSHSSIYNIAKRHNLNRLQPKHKKVNRMIIKTKAGELGHVDCHYLPTGLIEHDNKKYYLVGIIDDATRVLWAEVIPNIKSLTVMFASLKIINFLKAHYNIQFAEILSDNGAEFGSGKNAKNKDDNPFEYMLKELGIKHRYTRPYRPQTNGKIERFWKTLHSDLIEETVFNSLDHFKDELEQYLLYYNEMRPHQSLNAKTPAEFNKNLTKTVNELLD